MKELCPTAFVRPGHDNLTKILYLSKLVTFLTVLSLSFSAYANDKSFTIDPEKEPDPKVISVQSSNKGTSVVLSPGAIKSKKKRRHGYFSIGLGFATHEGFLASAGIGHEKLFGVDGLKLKLDAMLSPYRFDSRLALSIDTPRSILFAKMELKANRRSFFNDKDSLTSQQFGGLAQVGIKLGGGWRLTANYQLTSLKMENLEGLQGSPEFVSRKNWDNARFVSMVGISLEYDQGLPLAKRSYLSQGLRFKLTAERSLAFKDDDYRFARFGVNASYGLDIYKGIHLSFGFKGGYIHGKGQEIPFSQRYRIGGPYSEAPSILELGPFKRHGDHRIALGGEAFASGRALLHIPLIQKLGIYLFGGVDGSALLVRDSNTMANSWNGHFNGTAMAGIFWRSPIGPLRFTFATPFVQMPGAPKLMFSFTIGDGF